MGTTFSITGNAVNQHATHLDASVAQLNGNAQQFLAAVAGLPGVWRGAAFQSFDQLSQRFTQAQRDLNTALAGIQARVGTSGRVYDTHHAEQQSQIARTAASADWDAAAFRG